MYLLRILKFYIKIGQKHARVSAWCQNNLNIVGRFGKSGMLQIIVWTLCTHISETPTVLCPDVSVVLNARFLNAILKQRLFTFLYHSLKLFLWNTLSDEDKDRAFPPIVPDCVAEIRSRGDSEMLGRWIIMNIIC